MNYSFSRLRANPTRQSMRQKFKDADGGLAGTKLFDFLVAEPSFLQADDGTIRCYYTHDTGQNLHQINLTTAPSMLGPWSEPIAVIGEGASGEPAAQVAHSSDVVRDAGGKWYCFATNGFGNPMIGQDRSMHLYTSGTGNPGTWQHVGQVLNNDAFGLVKGYGNACIVRGPDNRAIRYNGKYLGLMEVWNGIRWIIHRAEASELVGPWTITHHLGILSENGRMSGGSRVFLIGGRFRNFYHFGSAEYEGTAQDYGPNLRTMIAYAESVDGIDWIVRERPMCGFEAQPFGPPAPPDYTLGTTQRADADLLPVIEGGLPYVYLTSAYVKNTTPTENETVWVRAQVALGNLFDF